MQWIDRAQRLDGTYARSLKDLSQLGKVPSAAVADTANGLAAPEDVMVTILAIMVLGEESPTARPMIGFSD